MLYKIVSSVRHAFNVGLAILVKNYPETEALLEDSPAIDTIPIVEYAVVEDQRGVSRLQGEACDIGAYEVEVVEVSSLDVLLPLVVYNYSD